MQFLFPFYLIFFYPWLICPCSVAFNAFLVVKDTVEPVQSTYTLIQWNDWQTISPFHEYAWGRGDNSNDNYYSTRFSQWRL